MALKRARMRHYTQTVWIDAICINQDDISERGHQVGLMPDIYSGAKTVLMYIGEISSCSPVVQRVAIQRLLNVNLRVPEPYWTEMLSTRYFTRLWILQEVALARKAVLMCGEQSLPWSVVREKARYWDLKHLPPVFHFDYKTYSTPEQVFDLLCLAKSCNASDPRDKVFALLGLLPSRRIGTLEADYSLSVEDIYAQVALNLVSTIGWPRVLSLAGELAREGRNLSSLPSWVPDWSAPVSPDSKLALAQSSTDNQEVPRLNAVYEESNKSLSLRLLYTPGLEVEWHYCGDDAVQFTAQYLCFQVPISEDETLDALYELFSDQLAPGDWPTISSTSGLLRQINKLYIELQSHDVVTDPPKRLSLRSLNLQSQLCPFCPVYSSGEFTYSP